jgi:apolipoprotein N-acyltransferase
VLSPTDELQLYHKHHLVWFGETIPLLDQLPWLKSIYESQSGMQYNGSFTPGTSFEPLPIPLANGEVIHAIPSVCYEDSVPRLARRFVRPQTQIIVNVTNDGWFKESAAAEQHFATAKFRCIELRRPMIRCANSGISAAIDSTGSIAHPDTGTPQLILDDKGSHFTRGSRLVEVDIPKQPSITLYMIIGDWGVIGASLSGLILAWALRKR